jgi:hypothetical protein
MRLEAPSANNSIARNATAASCALPPTGDPLLRLADHFAAGLNTAPAQPKATCRGPTSISSATMPTSRSAMDSGSGPACCELCCAFAASVVGAGPSVSA